MSHRIAVLGAGVVGRALATGLTRVGHTVTIAVRTPTDERHAEVTAETGAQIGAIDEAVAAADVVVLAIPAGAHADAVPALRLRGGQVVLDATNLVGQPTPEGFDTLGEFVASLLPDGVHYAKAFNTIGAEYLGNGTVAGRPAFLPIAGDEAARAVAVELGQQLGFDVADLGDRTAIHHGEAHAALWIHLAFGAGWGRRFGFTIARD